MTETEDMTAPVTRGELRKELAEHRAGVDAQFADLRAEIREQFASRVEIREQFASFAKSLLSEVSHMMRSMEESIRRELRELREEVPQMLRSFEENMRREFRGLDDKYNDLPPRVARIEAAELPLRVAKLEATVFPPPAPAKRPKRRRAG